MRKISVTQIILDVILLGWAVWVNLYAFYVLAVSGASLASKFLIFIMIILFDIFLAWSFIDRHYTAKIAEIKYSVIDARSELTMADAEMKYRDMFSSPDELIEHVHKHIKFAKEHIDRV